MAFFVLHSAHLDRFSVSFSSLNFVYFMFIAVSLSFGSSEVRGQTPLPEDMPTLHSHKSLWWWDDLVSPRVPAWADVPGSNCMVRGDHSYICEIQNKQNVITEKNDLNISVHHGDSQGHAKTSKHTHVRLASRVQ